MVTGLPSRPALQKMLIIASIVAPLATFITTIGAYWIVSTYPTYPKGTFWNLISVKQFFTMFFGILLSALAGLLGFTVKMSVNNTSDRASTKPLLKGLMISLVGSLIQVGGMAYDYYAYSGWSFSYGYLSGPIALLGFGTVVAAFGSFMAISRMFQFSIWGSQSSSLLNRKVLGVFFVFGTVALWLQLNLLIYWYAVDDNLRSYLHQPTMLQFGNISNPISGVLYSIPITLMLTTATRITKKFYHSIAAGLVFIIVNFFTMISPQHNFYLPLEAVLIVPIIFASIWTGNKLFIGSQSKIWEGTLLSPFGYLLSFPASVASYIQNINSNNFLSFAWNSLYILAVPSIIVGFFVSAYLSRWFARFVSADQRHEAELLVPA
jgi:hypothetical protein